MFSSSGCARRRRRDSAAGATAPKRRNKKLFSFRGTSCAIGATVSAAKVLRVSTALPRRDRGARARRRAGITLALVPRAEPVQPSRLAVVAALPQRLPVLLI